MLFSKFGGNTLEVLFSHPAVELRKNLTEDQITTQKVNIKIMSKKKRISDTFSMITVIVAYF